LTKWPWKHEKRIRGIEAVELPRVGIALSAEGTKVAAFPLPHDTAKEIAGGVSPTEGKVEGKYAAKIGTTWVIVTSANNPVLVEDYDKFVHIAADGLTRATGSQVTAGTIGVSTFLTTPLQTNGVTDSLETKLARPRGKEDKKG
jgi:hypothetical protein